MQGAGRSDIDLVLTGTDFLAAGIEQGVLMKVLPFVPGHFSQREWLWFGLWVLLGILIGHPRGAQPAAGENARINPDANKFELLFIF